MELDVYIREGGFDPATVTEPQRKLLTAAWKQAVAPNGGGSNATGTGSGSYLPVAQVLGDGDPFEAQMATIRAETTRRDEIKGLTIRACEQWTGNKAKIDQIQAIGEAAIEARTDVRDFKLNLLHLSRPDAPNVFAREEKIPSGDVMEAALCKSGGLAGIDKHYSDQTLSAADKQYKNGLSLSDLVLTFARKGGFSGMSLKGDLRGALQAAFTPADIRANSWGPSTSSALSGILSNTANKFLRMGFNAVDQSWRPIADRRNLTDFKAVSSYTLTGGLTFLDLPPGGEIKHGMLGAEAYSLQLATQARMIGIDRTQLINDDLGALTQVSRKLGRGGAQGLNKKFWTLWVNNSAFFTSGRANLITGAGTVLSVAALDTAYQKFILQTDPDGEPLGAVPAILLVPPALEATAQQILNSQLLNQQPASNAAVGSGNVWAGRLRLVVSPYLQNAAYTGFSATAWYILADPQDMATAEVGFLNGQEAPTVETADADFNMLGIAMRGYYDFGVSMVEYRAGVKSAGA